jgi:hypothetical protein
MTGILQKLPARNRVEAALMAREAWGSRVHENHSVLQFRQGA